MINDHDHNFNIGFELGSATSCYTCGSLDNGFMCSKQEDGTWENGKLLTCPDNGICYSFALGKLF